MPAQNERGRHIAMMKAALPYVAPENRHAMEILLQANSLVNLAMQPPSADISSCGIDGEEGHPFMPDPEAMLMNIREYCTKKESETIQILLNFIHADKLFKSYREFASSHPDMLEASEMNNSNSTPLSILFQLINGLGSISNNQDANAPHGNKFMMEFLMSQLSPEQKSTFEQLQGLMGSS